MHRLVTRAIIVVTALSALAACTDTTAPKHDTCSGGGQEWLCN